MTDDLSQLPPPGQEARAVVCSSAPSTCCPGRAGGSCAWRGGWGRGGPPCCPGEGHPQGEAPRWGHEALPFWQELARGGPLAGSPQGRLKGLLLRLSQRWDSYCLHRHDPQVPTTLASPSRPLAASASGPRRWAAGSPRAGLQAPFILPHLKVA